MSQGPGGPPHFGPPPYQQQPAPSGMPPSGPPPGAQPGYPSGPPQVSASKPAADGSGPTGPARLLALSAAGLGLVIYLMGFFGDYGFSFSTLLAGPLLIGGGLVTGAAVLPRGHRMLLPGALLVITGALMLLQLVIAGGSAPGVVVVALVLAILQAAAAAVAFLMHVGIISPPAPRAARPPHVYGPPGQQGYGGPPPGYGQPPPGFGAGHGGPPPPAGWGPPPQPVGPPPARPDADDIGATASIPIVSGGPADRPPARPTDETSLYPDGGMFAGPTSRVTPEQADEARGATALPRATSNGQAAGERTGSHAGSPADRGASSGSDDSMFTDPTSRTPRDQAGEGRHEQPEDERAGKQSEQTWFMPPEDRPPSN